MRYPSRFLYTVLSLVCCASTLELILPSNGSLTVSDSGDEFGPSSYNTSAIFTGNLTTNAPVCDIDRFGMVFATSCAEALDKLKKLGAQNTRRIWADRGCQEIHIQIPLRVSSCKSALVAFTQYDFLFSLMICGSGWDVRYRCFPQRWSARRYCHYRHHHRCCMVNTGILHQLSSADPSGWLYERLRLVHLADLSRNEAEFLMKGKART